MNTLIGSVLHALGVNSPAECFQRKFNGIDSEDAILTPSEIKILNLLYRCPAGLDKQDILTRFERGKKNK